MKMTGNTILITGGSSGIGMELARQLAKDNVVIITGRDRAKLDAAAAELGNVHIAQSDADDPNAIVALYETMIREFPALNVLINNAGIMRKISLRDGADNLADVVREIDTNLNGPIRMVAQFLPHLRKQKSPANRERLVRSRLRAIPLVTRLFGGQGRRTRFYPGSTLPVEENQRQGVRAGSSGYRNPVVQRRFRRTGSGVRERHGRSQARRACDLGNEAGQTGDPSGAQQRAETSQPFGTKLCAQSRRPDRPGFARSNRTAIRNSKSS